MGFLIVLVLLAWAAWVVFTQVGARQQITISTEHDVAAARKMVAASFGAVWTRVKGRGQENFRPKLRMHAPVLSVDYRSADGGGSSVHIWCSDYKTKFGLMAHAQLMWRKKRAVARALHPPVPVGPAALASAPVPAGAPVPARPRHAAPREVSAGEARAVTPGAPRAQETDWSDLDSIRREWPAGELDANQDLAAWRSGRQIYDANDDYGSMMQAGALMCQALRHELYGPGVLSGRDLPETVHSVLFASLSKPPDGRTLTDQASRQIRLALTIMKKHGWQPARMGGDGAMEVPFFEGGNYFLLAAAIGSGGRPADVPSFFTKNPVSIPEPAAAPGRIPEPAVAPRSAPWPHPEADPVGYRRHLDEVLDAADAGDVASEAYRNGLRASSQGDVAAALHYYEKAAQLGQVDAMYDAGCLSSDLGRTSASTYWFEQAARRGHAQSAYNLGVLALRAGDSDAARRWYQKAAELGDGGGCAALTQMAAEAGDKQAEMHWSRQGAELGHPFCMMRYGQLLMQASPNDPSVMERALVLEERAAQTGDADAMFLAGIINGQLGRRPEARWWLEQAERAGNPRARSVIDRYGF